MAYGLKAYSCHPLNIQHRVVLLLITCLLVGAESWQKWATKNGKVWCEETIAYAFDWWQPYTLTLVQMKDDLADDVPDQRILWEKHNSS